MLSNGKYKAVLHRSLVNKERTRMSWAVFVAPPHEAMIGPIPGLVNQENPPKFSTKTFAQFRHNKFNKLPQWEYNAGFIIFITFSHIIITIFFLKIKTRPLLYCMAFLVYEMLVFHRSGGNILFLAKKTWLDNSCLCVPS